MANLKNTTITDTGYLQLPEGPFSGRPVINQTVQTYTLPYGGYFNGNTYLNTPSSLALCPSTSTTPFTVEAWVYLTSTSTQYAVISATNYAYTLGFGSSLGVYDGTFKPWFGNYNGTWNGIISTGAAIPLNTWTHLAGVFTGSSTLLFQNGTLVASAAGVGTTTWAVVNQATTARIACRPDGSAPNTMTGFVSNARIVIGTAVYTSAFTPSTTALTAITNTQLLTCQSSTFVDNSSNNFSLTNNGSATTVGVSAFGSTYTWIAPAGVTQVEVLAVAGGGGGGYDGHGAGGGGGGGGLIYNPTYTVTPGNSYTVTVGQGGAGAYTTGTPGQNGSNSGFDALTAIGGGGGSGRSNALSGGSGGGTGDGTNGSQWTPGYATFGQGFGGGYTILTLQGAAGGGGAGGPGGNGTSLVGGGGGNGLAFNISGTTSYYAGGGGGSTYLTTGNYLNGSGGLGGGGAGGYSSSGTQGTTHTGGGGGGGGLNSVTGVGGPGGSGIVILRYAVTTSNTDPKGLMYYNTDLRGLEVYEGTARGWVTNDPLRNFGGHNLIPNSQSFYSSATTSNVSSVAIDDPFGGQNARRVTYLASGNASIQLQYTTSSIVANATYIFSVYIRKVTGNISNNIYSYQTSNGGQSPTTTSWAATGLSASLSTTAYTRVWATFSWTGTGTVSIVMPGYDAGNGNIADYYGPQLELASTMGPYTNTQGAGTSVPGSISGYRIHTYTTTGTGGFTAAVSGTVEVLVVGGGGAGGGYAGGGGGAGGVVYVPAYHVISGQSYTVTVGAGGTGTNNGGNSQFGNIVAIGGGRGSIGGGNTGYNAYAGGSGGGAGTTTSSYGSGTAMPGGYVVGQGNSGGQSVGLGNYSAGGGGGAGGPGQTMSNVVAIGGSGGIGVLNSISGTPTYYGGGGGGCISNNLVTTGTVYPPGIGGTGGGGTSASMDQNGSVLVAGWAANANTGGGGGGGGTPLAGGSGIVIVRYRYD